MDGIEQFEHDVKYISEKFNVNESHAACYLVNFCDEYICKQYDGGCKHFNFCKTIDSLTDVRGDIRGDTNGTKNNKERDVSKN